MNDYYHQAVLRGSDANHVMLSTGDAIWLRECNGTPATPPHDGRYYDSGYVRGLDFFRDGTRIPMIAVSKFTRVTISRATGTRPATSQSSNSSSTTGSSPRSRT
jgi:hypothetical protein